MAGCSFGSFTSVIRSAPRRRRPIRRPRRLPLKLGPPRLLLLLLLPLPLPAVLGVPVVGRAAPTPTPVPVLLVLTVAPGRGRWRRLLLLGRLLPRAVPVLAGRRHWPRDGDVGPSGCDVEAGVDDGGDGEDLAPKLLLDAVEVEAILVRDEVDGDSEVSVTSASTWQMVRMSTMNVSRSTRGAKGGRNKPMR